MDYIPQSNLPFEPITFNWLMRNILDLDYFNSILAITYY